MSPSPSQKSRTVTVAVLLGVGVAIAVVALVMKPKGKPPGSQGAQASSPGSGEKGVAGAKGNCTPTHCPGAACEACTATNCVPTTDGCDRIDSATERKLCEEIYECLNDPVNKCVREGDSLGCWCGTNPGTCVTSNEPPTQANGPCLAKVMEGAASRDAATIWQRFASAAYPLGRAVNLTLCRGTYCKNECKIP